MWELDYKESWVLKNWCFQTVVLEKALESLLDCKQSKLVNPKYTSDWIGLIHSVNPEYSLEGLKLKLQYFGHLMRRTDSLEETLMLGEIEDRIRGGDRGWDGRITSLTQWTWVWASLGCWWWTGKPGMLQSLGSKRVGHDWVTELSA